MDFNFAGLVGIVLGVLILKYRRQVKEWVGSIGFAERYLGAGGTQTFITLGSILLVILSTIHMLGGLGNFLRGVFGPILPGIG